MVAPAVLVAPAHPAPATLVRSLRAPALSRHYYVPVGHPCTSAPATFGHPCPAPRAPSESWFSGSRANRSGSGSRPTSTAPVHPCTRGIGPSLGGMLSDSPGRAGGERVLTHAHPGHGLVASGSWSLSRFLRSRIRLRLKARGSPSVARPFGGANIHWTFASFRLTLRFHRRWSQETLGFEAGSRSRLPGSRDISAVASGSCPLATLLLPCRASVNVTSAWII